jgi:hypothetical protein
MPLEGWDPSELPESLVERVRQDTDFALRLLHRETRDDALAELTELTEAERFDLSSRLDEIASMSFQDALEFLRRHGIVVFL